MIVCPVCEHAQVQGTECEVCGKRLGRGPSAADLALPRVPDLEPTSHAPVDAPEQGLPELEATRHAAAAAVAAEAVPGMEATRAVPVFNLMHHPAPALVLVAPGAVGILPPALYVGGLAWLGHIVVGLGVGDRMRHHDGSLPRCGRATDDRVRARQPTLARPVRKALPDDAAEQRSRCLHRQRRRPPTT